MLCRTLTLRAAGCLSVVLLVLALSEAEGGEELQQDRWKVQRRNRTRINWTRIQIDVNGPNVCDAKCCPGWTVQLKTKQCTKPRCLPRCHNRAVCRQPNICQCRPGFHGDRCEISSITAAPSVWLWKQPSWTSAPPATVTSPVTTVTPVTSPVTTVTTNTPDTTVNTVTPVTAVTPLIITEGLWSSLNTSASDPKKKYSLHWQSHSLKEAQAVLLKKALARGVGGSKITSVLLKHIETERNRLQSTPNTAHTSPQPSTKSFHTQHGQYTLIYTPAAAQTASSQTPNGQRTFGLLGSSERIKVLFTPTICRLRCTQNRCTNYCERGNITTVYNSEQQGAQGAPSPGFRLFLCPMLCKNGGVCIQKDRCLCPPNFTGKFCHIPVSSAASTNEIEKPISSSSVVTNQGLTESEYILPLQSPQLQARGSPMVKVRVQHPPEASVKIHQVLKVGSGPTVHERSETVTWSAGLSGSRSGIILPGERAEAPPPRAQATSFRGQAPPPRIQAQTIRGDFTYTETSGFKYCFREVRNGQCSSPMPGLRSQETCCRGDGLAWGINECTLCPPSSGSRGRGEGHCPKGFERVNGTQCVDVNECEQPGFCQNGNCVNTRGSYSCVCRQGFLLDASHGLCISQKVISSEKDQCFRILNQGVCSLHILRNITKQICCCSRVGKAWGRKCEACPFFGSAEFKEICPAGAGYHYSPNTLKITQRVAEINDTIGPQLVSESRPQQPEAPRHTTHPQPPTHGRTASGQYDPRQPITSEIYIVQGRHGQTQDRPPATSQPTRAQPPVIRTQTGRPSINRQTVRPLPVPATPRPSLPRPDTRVCEARPQVCGPGRCVDVPGGRHTCICNPGFILNAQAGHCQDKNECVLTPRPCLGGQCENTVGSYRCVCPPGYQSNSQQNQCSDIDECRQVPNPCTNGRCENTLGSFRCVCRTGYKLQDNTCTDIDECDDPLRCPGQECVNSQGSYKCVSCRPGFGLLNGQCSDIDECRQNPSPCSNGRCENTPGSYRCACQVGYRTQGNTCTDVNECEDPLQCLGQECVNTQGSYRCMSCRPGFALVSGRCSDIDECRQVPVPCSNGRCENTLGSYRCVCRPGYRLQGNTCTDVNECEDSRLCPGQECVNTQGSYRCSSCRSGYTFRNGQCADVDECVRSPSLCSTGRCENTQGSYRCVCRPGFRPEDNTCRDVDECENEIQCPGQQCVNSIGSFNCVSCRPGFEIINGQCKDIDECEDPLQCPGQQCVNSLGSYACVRCRGGHSMQNGQCADIDECASPQTCGPQSVCVNTDGSYRCECSAGYRAAGPGRQCRDINECLEGDFCFPKGECVNMDGSYMCVCAQGYQTGINRTSCQDVDECTREGVCQDGHCANTDGSFLCHCKTGFTSNPEKTACLDVDECVDSEGAVCGSLRCENTIGSFQCLVSCQPGYSITATGECVDINECANETVCGEQSYCQNLIGTYQCICDQGYESVGDGRSCMDINECETMVGVCGAARCWNVEGSFTCECDSQQEEFNPLTLQCVKKAALGDTGSSVQRGVSFPPRPGSGSALSPAGPGERRECYYNIEQQDSCRILTHNSSLQECCCTVGQGWGLRCLYDTCPTPGTAEFQALCPSGRGYVTSTVGAYSYKDVDECKLFDPEVCKGGVCVNNIPGYSCYCPSGHYYNATLMECSDNDECLSKDMCPGGQCVNTQGSFYCICEPPLVLDETQRNCVNISDFSMEYCWQHVTPDLMCQSLLRGVKLTFVDCCCLYGEAWGLHCALCPRRDEPDYEVLCREVGPPPNSPRYAERFNPVPRRGEDYFPPYSPLIYPDTLPGAPEYGQPDYDDYSPVRGTGPRSGLRERTPGSYSPYVPPGLGDHYYEDYDAAPLPPYGVPNPRGERAFGTRPQPPRAEGRPFSLAPLPEDTEREEPWRAAAPFPPFTDRRVGGDPPRRVYERQYEPFAGLMEGECGILQGCENGRCVRVGEGYTCDCYEGYQLDISSMTCIDVDECDDPTFRECVNGRCVNTEGSFRCVCLRGFMMSRRPNHCIPA
ncbi:latent-transforming growth factor beta-binding protein 4 isoform X2 [Astyanax mexicanus]|uniref:latent-transforming growth factor beta-binding protein 4 isoform X2 n=1 Tax=Astyanax mexicanus TaxID=7994 RepID=UPI0020CB2C99|nr:latent-transforming growth factor beta-binding protein 4 isoform X2 [Astyanax mexicanus]